MRTYKVTVFIGEVTGNDEDSEEFKSAVKDAMQAAIDADDSGDEDLDFLAEEVDEEF